MRTFALRVLASDTSSDVSSPLGEYGTTVTLSIPSPLLVAAMDRIKYGRSLSKGFGFTANR
jgi:hypothetical protein